MVFVRNQKWLGHVHNAINTASQVLADASHLPEILFAIALLVVLALCERFRADRRGVAEVEPERNT